LQSRGDEARWDIGGGIVHDSQVESEWDEAWAKFIALRALTST
jgi:anthranilate/para-aminobenzoate synthase component I